MAHSAALRTGPFDCAQDRLKVTKVAQFVGFFGGFCKLKDFTARGARTTRTEAPHGDRRSTI